MLLSVAVVCLFYLFQIGECEITCTTKPWRVIQARTTFSNNVRRYLLRVVPANETVKANGEPDFSVFLADNGNVLSVDSPSATLIASFGGEYFFSLNNGTRKPTRRRNRGSFKIVSIVVKSVADSNASTILTMTNGNFSCDLPELPAPKILECRELPTLCPAATVVKTNSTHEIGKLTLNVTWLSLHDLTIGFDVPVKDVVLIEDIRRSKKPWGSKLRPTRKPTSSDVSPTRSPGQTVDPEQFHPITGRPSGRPRGSGGKPRGPGGRGGMRPRGPGGRGGMRPRGPDGRAGGLFRGRSIRPTRPVTRPSRRPRMSPSYSRRNKILKANSSECGKVFTFKRRLPWKSRRNVPLKAKYMITLDQVKPVITHIQYGNRFCSTSCGVKPDCEQVDTDDFPADTFFDDLAWSEQTDDLPDSDVLTNTAAYNDESSSYNSYAGMVDSDLIEFDDINITVR